MDGHKNRADPERFFPKGEASLEGALKKMSYLKQNTEIQVQVPLKAQIYALVSSHQAGLTVKEISLGMCLNTKTCAKVLDEMVYKYKELKATAHRYGRVFVHKYHINTQSQETTKEAKDMQEYLAEIREDIIVEINAIEQEIGEEVKKAISQSLKSEKKHSRQRVTHQSYIRALFVVARVRQLRVCSVFDIKEMIKNDLEPNAKWCLDKKTVLRIIWKLRNCGFLKELCFRIRLRKDDDHEIFFLGEHYNLILEDKKHNKSSNVIYKLLAALPEISPSDPLVLECPAIKNPTNRKPFTQSQTAVAKTSINIRSKVLREIVVIQNSAYKKLKNSCYSGEAIENIVRMEEIINGVEIKDEETKSESQEGLSRGYSLAIFAKAMFKIASLALFARYNLLFSTFRMPLCYTALKDLFNTQAKNCERDQYSKYSLAYGDFSLETKEMQCYEGVCSEIELLSPVSLPKKRKHTLEEMGYQLKKLILIMERKPGLVNSEMLKQNGKGIDTDAGAMMRFISNLGYAQCREGAWEFKYNAINYFLYAYVRLLLVIKILLK